MPARGMALGALASLLAFCARGHGVTANTGFNAQMVSATCALVLVPVLRVCRVS